MERRGGEECGRVFEARRGRLVVNRGQQSVLCGYGVGETFETRVTVVDEEEDGMRLDQDAYAFSSPPSTASAPPCCSAARAYGGSFVFRIRQVRFFRALRWRVYRGGSSLLLSSASRLPPSPPPPSGTCTDVSPPARPSSRSPPPPSPYTHPHHMTRTRAPGAKPHEIDAASTPPHSPASIALQLLVAAACDGIGSSSLPRISTDAGDSGRIERWTDGRAGLI
ncbi:hypothetical protein R3P38DRAFT_3173174 [Favolaschia claudopus]|uniref:Uncharacterized protein n=1 Tax=Favolaschia claudopus TaxID=2862362 RepID=A0AAW0DGP7_9AGAR